MYARIADHPSVRERYQAQLVAAGAITDEEAEARIKEARADLAARQKQVRKGVEEGDGELDRGSEAIPREEAAEPETAVALERLRELNGALGAVPEGFTVHPKLVKQL